MNRDWHSSFATGHHHIDQHHQELFHLTTLLDQALFSHSRDQIQDVLLFLEEYTQYHFLEEEVLMQSASYPDYHRHKHEHDLFKDMTQQVRILFHANAALSHCVFCLRKLIDRMMVHIQTVDIDIASIAKGDHRETLT